MTPDPELRRGDHIRGGFTPEWLLLITFLVFNKRVWRLLKSSFPSPVISGIVLSRSHLCCGYNFVIKTNGFAPKDVVCKTKYCDLTQPKV